MFIDLNVQRLYLDGSQEAELLVPGRQRDGHYLSLSTLFDFRAMWIYQLFQKTLRDWTLLFPITGHPPLATDD